MSEQIWFKDPSVLFAENTWMRFAPVQTMTTTEALNAVVRFSVYSSIILAGLTFKSSYLSAIPIVGLASIVLFELFPNGKQIESYINAAKNKMSGKEKFTMPTTNNPFMNVLLTEIQDDPDREDAAPVTDDKVRAEISKAFQSTTDIYMDTADAFDQAQAMRTFNTRQSSRIPNDQDGFLSWLAKGYDEPDTSSAALARGAKLDSETYASARGSVKRIPNSVSLPKGTTPSSEES
jgi:hypothetical protein